MRTAARTLFLMLVAMLCTISAAPMARAADEPPAVPPPAPGQILESWALTPTGVDPSQPGERPYLAYTLERGTTITDSVTVWNYSDIPMTFWFRVSSTWALRSR